MSTTTTINNNKRSNNKSKLDNNSKKQKVQHTPIIKKGDDELCLTITQLGKNIIDQHFDITSKGNHQNVLFGDMLDHGGYCIGEDYPDYVVTEIDFQNVRIVLDSKNKDAIKSTLLVIHYPDPFVLLMPSKELQVEHDPNDTDEQTKRKDFIKSVLKFLTQNASSIKDTADERDERRREITETIEDSFNHLKEEDEEYEEELFDVLKLRYQVIKQINEWRKQYGKIISSIPSFDVKVISPPRFIEKVYAFCSCYLGLNEQKHLDKAQKEEWYFEYDEEKSEIEIEEDKEEKEDSKKLEENN